MPGGRCGPAILARRAGRTQPGRQRWSIVSGSLAILAEGRSLARGGEGETIRAMNLTSRATVTGRIGPDGAILVGWN
jgi:hypothetical protein